MLAETEAPRKRKEKKNFNLLYVDDEISNLKIFKISFRRFYNVFTAENGNDAIEILRNEDIHLIITDQKMPEMTGTELLEKTREEFPDVIKIILTGFSDIESIVRAVNKCGIYKYVTKPYDQGELKFSIDKGLENFNLKKEKNGLLDELAEANKELESKVELRTQELQKVNERLTEGLDYARTVQQYLIPKDEELALFFGDVFSIYRPKDHVSGDFYWFHKLNEDEGIFAMVDCMGHGVSAALLTMVGDSLLAQIVKDKHIYSPDQILTELDKGVARTFNHEKTGAHESMDGSVIYFNKKKKIIEFSGAKSDIVYEQDGIQTRLRGTKKSIGSVWKETFEFEKHTIQLKGLTGFYLFSDGYVDQMNNESGKKIGTKNLLNLMSVTSVENTEKQKLAFENYLDAWQKEADQIDDITLVGFKFSIE